MDEQNPAGTGSDDGDSVELSIETVMQAIDQGAMTKLHGVLRYSSNYTFLVTIEHDDLCLTAVYKPRKGERPLWDFPNGTLCNRERAAYLTSEVLGWGVVPPTALRDGAHGVGSVQFYIDHDPNLNYFSFEEDEEQSEALAPQIARMALFDVLVNNADRKGGHMLLDAHGHLWGIDHGITFNEEHKLRTVIWDFAGQPVPGSLLHDVECLQNTLQDTNHAYRQELVDLLTPPEIDAFQQRVVRLLKTHRFPKPGPGPNYPWPAV